MATNFLKKLVSRSKSRSISPSNHSTSSINSSKVKKKSKDDSTKQPIFFNLNAQDPRSFFDRTMDEINYEYYNNNQRERRKHDYERKPRRRSPTLNSHIVSQDNISYTGFHKNEKESYNYDDLFYQKNSIKKEKGRNTIKDEYLKKNIYKDEDKDIDDKLLNYEKEQYLHNNFHSAPNSPPKYSYNSKQRLCDFISPSMLYKHDIEVDGNIVNPYDSSRYDINRYNSYNTLQSNMFGDPRNLKYKSSGSPFLTTKNTNFTSHPYNHLNLENKNDDKNKNSMKNISKEDEKTFEEPIYESLKRNNSSSPKITLQIPNEFSKIGSTKTKDPYNEINNEKKRAISKSPSKKSTISTKSKEGVERSASAHLFKISSSNIKMYDYLSPICKKVGCMATIYVTNPDSTTAKFLVCKSQLSHVSSYFRNLFMENSSLTIPGVKQHSMNTYTLVVSSLPSPKPSLQFQWYIESTIADPVLREISPDTLETLMRLSKRFSTPSLTIRCSQFIINTVSGKPPMIALCWLNWIIKHRFDQGCYDAILPVVSRMSLTDLERHRAMLSERIYGDIVSGKLRCVYKQVSNIFKVIHEMDHFVFDGRICPRCEKTGNDVKSLGNKIRLKVSPCEKMIGCGSCYKNSECELKKKGNGEYEAYFKCDHDLKAFGEKTEDCWCQEKTYRECFLKFESLCPLESNKIQVKNDEKKEK
uniref:BTB domain-containing protein n=1 Tax=Strongyloides stercoralis TaxID=6248 RepID=A0A0K0E3Q3_STRER